MIRCLALGTTLVLLIGGCSKPKPPPERTEPWPAPSAQVPQQELAARYALAPDSRVRMALHAREAKLAGEITTITGQLDVDLLDLTRTQGRVRVDVASILITLSDQPTPSREATTQARNWLDLGSSKPEAEREQNRWAEFVIAHISEPSARAAHQGKRVTRASLPPATSDPAQRPEAAAADGGSPATSEVREVRFSARGDLSLHNYRVEQTVLMRARFYYPKPATVGSKPTRIMLETRKPLRLALAAYDVKPRDAAGTFVSRDLNLLGKTVAREARTSLSLIAIPSRD
jgi:hypothetical protein